jgi:hypothetical protein
VNLPIPRRPAAFTALSESKRGIAIAKSCTKGKCATEREAALGERVEQVTVDRKPNRQTSQASLGFGPLLAIGPPSSRSVMAKRQPQREGREHGAHRAGNKIHYYRKALTCFSVVSVASLFSVAFLCRGGEQARLSLGCFFRHTVILLCVDRFVVVNGWVFGFRFSVKALVPVVDCGESSATVAHGAARGRIGSHGTSSS